MIQNMSHLQQMHESKPKTQDGKTKHHVQKKTNITQQNYKVEKISNHQK